MSEKNKLHAVFGLDINDYSTSSCLLIDGAIAAAAQEERFNREKRTRKFPSLSMDWCLEKSGLTIDDISAIAVSVNPAVYLENFSPLNTERARYRGELLFSPLNLLMGKYGLKAGGETFVSVKTESGNILNVYYFNHHDAHAATAFYASPFEKCAVLTADAFGEKDSTVFYSADANGLNRILSVDFPHSLGSFYAAITEFLGMRPDCDEWKLMGASAHGNPHKYFDIISDLITVNSNGTFSLKLKYFNHFLFNRPGMFTQQLEQLLGPRYLVGCVPDERFFDIAAATQKVLEETLFSMMNILSNKTGQKNLCFGGGVAMNCALNGKIHEQTLFANVYIPAAPDDSGTSIGAAYSVSKLLWPDVKIIKTNNCFYGPSYSDNDIEMILNETVSDRFQKIDVPITTAKLLCDGKIVAFFQGAMEFGSRALGNRSILAHPGIPYIKDRLNRIVKKRESYRPFAPSILSKYQDEWFECGDNVYYMEKAYRVRESKREIVPAIVHADGTARLQTVTEKSNPIFYRTILEFMELTGIPMVLNTSFNYREEPVVMTPRDALRTFFSCGVDTLIIGSFLVSK